MGAAPVAGSCTQTRPKMPATTARGAAYGVRWLLVAGRRWGRAVKRLKYTCLGAS
jgi:hypothetical protein